MMNKDILSLLRRDEPVPLLVVKPLNLPGGHESHSFPDVRGALRCNVRENGTLLKAESRSIPGRLRPVCHVRRKIQIRKIPSPTGENKINFLAPPEFPCLHIMT